MKLMQFSISISLILLRRFSFLVQCTVVEDNKLSGYEFCRKNLTGPLTCADECRANANCKSINFQFSTLSCELSNTSISTSQETLTSVTGYRYIELDTFPQIRKDICHTNNPCPLGTTCSILSSGLHVCSISECLGDPPSISSATISVTDRSVGTTLTYTCDSGSMTTTTCCSNGTWTQPQTLCATDPAVVTACLESDTCWVHYNFSFDNSFNNCSGPGYVTKTVYNNGLLLGAVVCGTNQRRYKLFLSDNIQGLFLNIGDGSGHGQDHCELVLGGSESAAALPSDYTNSPSVEGYWRLSAGQEFTLGTVGKASTSYYFDSWIECGVNVPGNYEVVNI